MIRKNGWLFVQGSGIVLLGGFITGVLTGIGSRIVMGIIASVFPHMARGLHLEGVLFLLILGILLTLGVSLIYLVFTYLKIFLVLQKPLNFGIFFIILFGIPFFLSNPDGELFGPQAPLAITLFSCLFILSGYTLGVTVKWLEKKVNPLIAKISFFLLIVPTCMGLFGLIKDTVENFMKALQLF